MTDNPARHRIARRYAGIVLALASGIATMMPATAQEPAPLLDDDTLVDLVAPVALYPDDLLAIVLPASTYPLQVVEAARFVDDRAADPTLQPDPAWDDSVVALLNYPEALELLNDDLDWTWRLGEAVLAQQGDVLEAVELFRDQAWLAGNLKTDDYQVVERSGEGIAIRPADREVVYVPYYDPAVVVARSAWPVYHYHPFAYPLYYYPYPVGHRFYSGWFWGVSTAFAISWRDRYLHLHYYDHVRHPYYGRRYVSHRYFRHRRFSDHHVYRGGQRVVHRQGQAYRWHPRRGHGARPGYRRFEGRDRATLRYGDRQVRPGSRAARAARTNRERQRYRTFDNVIDRDRRNARRGPARDRRGNGADNRRDRGASGNRNRTQRFASGTSRNNADRQGTARRDGARRARGARGARGANTRRDAATDRQSRQSRQARQRATPGTQRFASNRARRATRNGGAVGERRARGATPTRREAAPNRRGARPRGNVERPARFAPSTRSAERRAAPRAERSSRGRAQPAPRSERRSRGRTQSTPRADRGKATRSRGSAQRSRSASRPSSSRSSKSSRRATRGGRDGGSRGRRSRRD